MDDKLRVIFNDVFDVPAHSFRDDLSSDILEAWDSIKHLTLVLSLEQAFNVHFSPDDIGRLTSVRAIKAMLLAHLATAMPATQ